jgi:hypothetical protein
MRPATLTLIVAGMALAVGSGMVASFMLPVRSTIIPSPGGYVTTFEQNCWGQTLAMSVYREFPAVMTNALYETWESGPFRNAMREDRWMMKSKRKGDLVWTEKIVWYLHGSEVSEDEWERR